MTNDAAILMAAFRVNPQKTTYYTYWLNTLSVSLETVLMQ